MPVEQFKSVGRGIGGREGRDVDFASAGILLLFGRVATPGRRVVT